MEITTIKTPDPFTEDELDLIVTGWLVSEGYSRSDFEAISIHALDLEKQNPCKGLTITTVRKDETQTIQTSSLFSYARVLMLFAMGIIHKNLQYQDPDYAQLRFRVEGRY